MSSVKSLHFKARYRLKKALRVLIAALFTVQFFMLIPETSFGITVKIHYRPVLFPSFVLSHRSHPWVTSRFSDAFSFLSEDAPSNFYRLSPQLQTQFSRLVFSNPESWGHVVVELPFKLANGQQIIGWRPGHSGELIVEDFLKLVSDPQYFEVAPHFEGVFFDETEWLWEVENPIIPTTISLELSTEEVRRINENIENIRSDIGYQYQLRPSKRGSWGPKCFNCVWILSEIFAGTSAVVDFLPKNGSLMALDFALRKNVQNEAQCFEVFFGTSTFL